MKPLWPLALVISIAGCAPSPDQPPTPDVFETRQASPTAVSPQPARATTPVTPVVTTSAPSASECDHSYFPVRPSARWTYRVEGTASSELVETHVPSTSSEFIVRSVSPNSTSENQWRCSSEGLVALQATQVSSSQIQLRFKSTNVTGVTIPSAEKWTQGYSWTSSYEVEGDSSSQGGNPARGRITLDSKIEGEEPVNVPAGSYMAVKVAQHSSMELNVTMRDFSAPMSISVEMTRWYVRGVGMVKSIGGGELGEAITELKAFTP